ncbi:PEP-CTERM sorting domain-containing protein [Aeoliella sp. SH292]|uniref:PEP-CTERM sorting domain-containing protein n=1 Tax=Aeoliella sp. SH292 TaxID=3454464 RepID=UPI003F943396
MIHRSSIFSRPLVGLGTWVCAGLLVTGLAVQPAGAALVVSGDYAPADNPLTTAAFNRDPAGNFGVMEGNEGIQVWQVFTVSIFDPTPGPVQNYQFTLEEGDTNKVDIEIGRTDVGYLELNGGSMLRYGHLVIGGIKADVNLDGAGTEFTGTDTGIGYVTISGTGTVYNNNPATLPASLTVYTDPTPRPTDQGYDVYVGLTGTGTLEVFDGGRMEIGDSLYVGMAENSNGEVLVSGVGSVIAQAGITQDTSGSGDDETNPMLIGVLGTGALRIFEGGLVSAQAGVGIGSLGVAIKDGDDGDFGSSLDTGEITGYGEVEIDGNGSRLNTIGGVTVGWFYNDYNNYENGEGNTSRLTISNNGRLNMVRDNSEDGSDDPADFIVGKGSVVTLETNGRINTPDAMLNDGIVGGHGQIGVGTFSNRRFGIITVGEGERLQITSSGTEIETELGGAYFMANTGLIDVKGGELVFQRTLVAPTDTFYNRVDPGFGLTGPQAGVINGQDATLRFRSGLTNQAVVAFTAGDNRVSGDVLNDLTGSILLRGESNTVFENDLTNFGVLELGADGSAVTMTVLGDFINLPTSTLSLSIGASSTGFQLSNVMVGGNILLGGLLEVDLGTTGPAALDPMPGDEFELISGAGLLLGAFGALDLPTLSDPTWQWLIDYSNSDVTLIVSDLITIGGDFNGDGIVNEDDLAVWEMNFGLQMGATGAMGDADGDGDVDAADYYIWLAQLGGAPMVPGSLAGGAQVPEPSSMLLLLGAVAAGAWRLRRK